MSAHPVVWQTPQPLWARFGAGAGAAVADDQVRPAILRFASDDFMDRLLATLARDPARIDALIARPESWRGVAPDEAEPVQQTPLPSAVQGALRRTLSLAPRSAVAATAAEATITEQGRVRERRPLKLYHPAHQRFYLVGASLVCGVPGLPERAVAAGGAERVNFVVRRLLPEPADSQDPAALREFALVRGADAPRWQRVGAATDEARYVPGEELLPVFPLPHQDDDGRARTLWGGLVPVGRREEYIATAVDRTVAPGLAAGQLQALRGAERPVPQPSKQARLAQFQLEVAEPWKNLVRASHRLALSLAEVSPLGGGASADEVRRRIFDHNLQQQNVSWLVLLDLADFLQAYLPDVWAEVESGGTGAGSLSTPRRELLDLLRTAAMPAALTAAMRRPDDDREIRASRPSLRDALVAIRAAGVRERLEGTEISYTAAEASLWSDQWPDFHFLLAGVDTGNAAVGPIAALDSLAAPGAADPAPDPLAGSGAAEDAAAKLDRLTALVGRALEPRPETDAPPLPFALQMRNALAANVGDAGWFVVRFVYTCGDCGPLCPPTLSAPTQRFQLASFYDPDAPARAIRITLPMDTSPAGLRKFNRNTAFVISDMLCGQIQRAKGLGLVDLVRSVLPWPLHKKLELGDGGSCHNGAGINIGMICSLSIPIITICALILLIIMVSILDYIFRWLPYFIMCFPLPKLGGKKAAA